MGAGGEVAFFATLYPVTALLLHRGEAAHIEAGAKRPALTGQDHRTKAAFVGEPVRGGDQRIEHGGIERVHLVRPHQTDVGDAFRDRYRDALFHGWFSLLFFVCRFTEWRRPDLVNQPINRQSL
jgi:hypothetical protein